VIREFLRSKMLAFFVIGAIVGFSFITCKNSQYKPGNCIIAYTNPDKNVLLESGIRPFLLLKIKDIDEQKKSYLAETFINSRLSSEAWIAFDEVSELGDLNLIKCSEGHSILDKVYHDE
jgi:hypothetical protein